MKTNVSTQGTVIGHLVYKYAGCISSKKPRAPYTEQDRVVIRDMMRVVTAELLLMRVKLVGSVRRSNYLPSEKSTGAQNFHQEDL
jgi:hypothetical protein